MARKPTEKQEAALGHLKSSSPTLHVQFFDYAMEGEVALVQRTVLTRMPGHSWSAKAKDEMYRVHPDGTCQGV